MCLALMKRRGYRGVDSGIARGARVKKQRAVCSVYVVCGHWVRNEADVCFVGLL